MATRFVLTRDSGAESGEETTELDLGEPRDEIKSSSEGKLNIEEYEGGKTGKEVEPKKGNIARKISVADLFPLKKFSSLLTIQERPGGVPSLRSLSSPLTKDNIIGFPLKSVKVQRFRMVEAKTGQPDGLSFEVVNRPGYYLLVKGSDLMISNDVMNRDFKKACTYLPLESMWFTSFFAFESVIKPSNYIRLTSDEELELQPFDGTELFKQEASFQLTSKHSTPCLQVGISTLVRMKSSEFCRGKVVAIRKNKVCVNLEDQDLRLRVCVRELVPNVVPRSNSIKISTRVIARPPSKPELDIRSEIRNQFCLGYVTAVKNNDRYEVTFDNGEVFKGMTIFELRIVQEFHVHEIDDN